MKELKLESGWLDRQFAYARFHEEEMVRAYKRIEKRMRGWERERERRQKALEELAAVDSELI